jgi:hypothetical protein
MHWKMTGETGLDPQELTSQIVTAWLVEESGKQKNEVLAVAAKNQDLQPYLDIAENAGLAVAAIDLASSAGCRSLCRTPAPATGGKSSRRCPTPSRKAGPSLTPSRRIPAAFPPFRWR